jgi:hypothetical protein
LTLFRCEGDVEAVLNAIPYDLVQSGLNGRPQLIDHGLGEHSIVNMPADEPDEVIGRRFDLARQKGSRCLHVFQARCRFQHTVNVKARLLETGKVLHLFIVEGLQVEDEEGFLVHPVPVVRVGEEPDFTTVRQNGEARIRNGEIPIELRILGRSEGRRDRLDLHEDGDLAIDLEGIVDLSRPSWCPHPQQTRGRLRPGKNTSKPSACKKGITTDVFVASSVRACSVACFDRTASSFTLSLNSHDDDPKYP